jgi:hypothetical protein
MATTAKNRTNIVNGFRFMRISRRVFGGCDSTGRSNLQTPALAGDRYRAVVRTQHFESKGLQLGRLDGPWTRIFRRVLGKRNPANHEPSSVKDINDATPKASFAPPKVVVTGAVGIHAGYFETLNSTNCTSHAIPVGDMTRRWPLKPETWVSGVTWCYLGVPVSAHITRPGRSCPSQVTWCQTSAATGRIQSPSESGAGHRGTPWQSHKQRRASLSLILTPGCEIARFAKPHSGFPIP